MKNITDLQSDPNFPFQVGQLVGAAEMMSVYMSLHGSSEARGMAERVHKLLSFFLTEEELAPLPWPRTSAATDTTPALSATGMEIELKPAPPFSQDPNEATLLIPAAEAEAMRKEVQNS